MAYSSANLFMICWYEYNTDVRIFIGFPMEPLPGMRAEAAQLALGLQASGHEVIALGEFSAWRDSLCAAGVTLNDLYPTDSAQKIAALGKELDPQVLHTFGLLATRRLLPVAVPSGAGRVVTLGHQDIAHVNPRDLDHASTVFLPCDHLREQLIRRLPATTSLQTTPYAMPPPISLSVERRRMLAAELAVDETAPVVLLADYFHDGETEIARLLIEAAPLLAEYEPSIQILIVGTGPRRSELDMRATEINKLLGRRAIILAGYHYDLAPICSLATVAVGSGRFAVEAMAAGVALVAAGAAGLVGTITADNVHDAQQSCYGRHGALHAANVRALASEIIGLIQFDEYRLRFARDGQQTLLASAGRQAVSESIARSYRRAAPAWAFDRSPRRLTAILPDDLRELLFTLPAIFALRAGYPQALLRIIASSVHCGLLRQLVLDAQVLQKPRQLRDWPALLRGQWNRRSDICLAFSEDPHTALLALSSLAAHRWGFIEGNGNLFLSDHLPARLPASPARALQLTHSLDISTGVPVPPPELLAETREIVQLSLLAAEVEYDDPLLLLCPQVDETRAWPLEQWIALSAALIAARPERVAVLGAAEANWPDRVVKVMPVQDSLILATLLYRATLVVAPDSAALHLADIMGIPTVGLYVATDPADMALPDSHSKVLYHAAGLAELTAEEVVTAIEMLLPTSL